jgi:multidrug resistance efflux pump
MFKAVGMSKIEEAMSAFAGALDRMERAASGQSVRSEARSELETQIAALKEDRAKLAEELDIARSNVRRLEGLNALASTELGSALKDIDELLAQ